MSVEEAATVEPRLRTWRHVLDELAVFALPLVGYGCLLALAWARRAPGLDPPSLWNDDAWVGFIVRYAEPADLWIYAATTPMAFSAVLQVFWSWIDDPELALQAFPFVCALLQIPAFGLLVTRLTGWRSLGFLGAAAISVNRMLAYQSVRVKQYSSDALVVVLLLLAGLPSIRDASPRRLARLTVLAAASFLISLPSIFVSLPLVHLPLLAKSEAGRRDWRSLGRAAAVVGAFDAFVALFYLFRLRAQVRPEVRRFWDESYLPLDSIGSALEFLVRTGSHVLGEAFPRSPSWLTVEPLIVAGAVELFLVVAGFVFLVGSGRRMLEAVFYLAFYAGTLTASALGIYPFGGGRTWVFAHPVLLVLGFRGLGALTTDAARSVPRLGRWLPVLLVTAAAALALVCRWEVDYRPPNRDRQLVERLDRLWQPGDLVCAHWFARHALGLYTTRPIVPVFDNEGRKFIYRADGWDLAFVNGRKRLPGSLLDGRRRMLYLETFVGERRRRRVAHVGRLLEERGFRVVETTEAPAARLLVYEMQEGPPFTER